MSEQPRRSFDDQVVALALLSEPVRRSLYRYVVSRGDDVSRDEAASAAGIDRGLAAFHLDKLVERGLLSVTFRRLTGRTGPGSGRPAKLYRRSAVEHEVTLPPRRYELAARLLAAGVESAADGPAAPAVDAVARRFGEELGRAVGDGVEDGATAGERAAALADALGAHGYEPFRDGATLRLRNCPFHALAEAHRELVCGMSRALVEGVVGGMGDGGLEACREFQPGHCCATVIVDDERN